ncbi:MAG TPA: RsmE family RNA methyltransferase [Candidatus Acidoferrales bacterium]|jgi:16S rRNA (uracil1498-N3)-methyltransferase|nr:RsmE family RNA methyltransferase [Candidatus Acidoferrales bacterium]
MRRRFFVEEFEERTATLRGDAAHHLGRVLRAEAGQLYELSDGQCVWLARTESVGRDAVRFSLVEPLAGPVASVRMALLLGIVKFDRFEWALEKATELGADEIAPLAADRSEKGLLAAAGKRAERWKRILAESAQQARRLRIPALRDAAKSRDAFRESAAPLKLLLSERAGARPLREVLDPFASEIAANRHADDAARVAVAIGPEGGWTDEEFESAGACGFVEVSLGTNILRAETAVCAALAAVQYAFGVSRSSEAKQDPITSEL